MAFIIRLAAPAVYSPKTRRDCSSPRAGAQTTLPSWWTSVPVAFRSNMSLAGPLFCGLRIAVDPGVFVPRRRTEFLVHQATALAQQAQAGAVPPPPMVIVDLCCGSGAVGAALAAALEHVDLYAADLEPAAVLCARRNVAAAGGQVFQGDLYEPLPTTLLGRVDLLVANAPYVPTGAMALLPPEARLHEPRLALDGGGDGLDIARRVVEAAPLWLAPGGCLLIETSERQAL